MPVDVDEDTLQKIADKTGGKYYRADNAERFRQIYAEIDKLEKTEAVINKFAQFDECFRGWCRAAGAAGGRSRAGTNLIPEVAVKIYDLIHSQVSQCASPRHFFSMNIYSDF